MPDEIILYTTAGCHLCEQAEAVIRQVQAEQPQWRLYKQDIADSAVLVDKYGVRIPVLGVPGSDEELGWPFDEGAVRAFLEVV